MGGIVVAIDGPAGAGKSTVSRRLAQALRYGYVDTGAMYRVIGVLAAELGIDATDTAALAALCNQTQMEFQEHDAGTRVYADGRDLSAAIRTPEAAQLASKISAVPVVRECLVAKQRALAARGGVVMEGRDIGTVVCPDAPVKIFLEASVVERARRRTTELHGQGRAVDGDAIARDIADRDARDRSRAHSPLRPAADATIMDTTDRTIDEVVEALHALITSRVNTLERQS